MNFFQNTNRDVELLKELYLKAKESNIGDFIVCPSCNTKFEKKSHSSVFCKSLGKTKCKDHYWNNVDESKRNNTTRISPANSSFIERMRERDRLLG